MTVGPTRLLHRRRSGSCASGRLVVPALRRVGHGHTRLVHVLYVLHSPTPQPSTVISLYTHLYFTIDLHFLGLSVSLSHSGSRTAETRQDSYNTPRRFSLNEREDGFVAGTWPTHQCQASANWQLVCWKEQLVAQVLGRAVGAGGRSKRDHWGRLSGEFDLSEMNKCRRNFYGLCALCYVCPWRLCSVL